MTVISVSDGVNGSSLPWMSAQWVLLPLKAARILESTTKATCEHESRASRRKLRDSDKILFEWIVFTIFFPFFKNSISKRCGQASKINEQVQPLAKSFSNPLQKSRRKSASQVYLSSYLRSDPPGWMITLRHTWLMNDETTAPHHHRHPAQRPAIVNQTKVKKKSGLCWIGNALVENNIERSRSLKRATFHCRWRATFHIPPVQSGGNISHQLIISQASGRVCARNEYPERDAQRCPSMCSDSISFHCLLKRLKKEEEKSS